MDSGGSASPSLHKGQIKTWMRCVNELKLSAEREERVHPLPCTPKTSSIRQMGSKDSSLTGIPVPCL